MEEEEERRGETSFTGHVAGEALLLGVILCIMEENVATTRKCECAATRGRFCARGSLVCSEIYFPLSSDYCEFNWKCASTASWVIFALGQRTVRVANYGFLEYGPDALARTLKTILSYFRRLIVTHICVRLTRMEMRDQMTQTVRRELAQKCSARLLLCYR